MIRKVLKAAVVISIGGILAMMTPRNPLCWGHPDAWEHAPVEEVWQDTASKTGWFATLSLIRRNKKAGPRDYDICYPNRHGNYVFKKQVEITARAAKEFMGHKATLLPLGMLALCFVVFCAFFLGKKSRKCPT